MALYSLDQSQALHIDVYIRLYISLGTRAPRCLADTTRYRSETIQYLIGHAELARLVGTRYIVIYVQEKSD